MEIELDRCGPIALASVMEIEPNVTAFVIPSLLMNIELHVCGVLTDKLETLKLILNLL